MASKTNIAGWAAAGAVLLVLSGTATESLAAKRRPTHHAAHHHPAAPASAGGLETQAMAFESVMRHGREIDPEFGSSAQVNRSLQAGAGHDADALEADMIAYAALAALQEPSFVEGVHREAQGSELAARLSADPDAVLQLPGARDAAERASAALRRQGEDLAKTGERVQHASYTVQQSAWSRARIANPRPRLNAVKRISAAAYRPEAGEAEKLRTALADGGRGGGASPVVTRGVALAALSVLGEADRGRSLMKEPNSGLCLTMAKLNYYQCLASAGTEYEDIYCLGKHALVDTGQCVTQAAEAHGQRSVIPASFRR